MNLGVYTSNHIDSFLLNYEIFVKDLAELADDWSTLDPEEQSEHQVIFMQVWGNCHVLGRLFQDHHLSQLQENCLAQFDQMLLQQTALMEKCFKFDLARLLVFFRWGTPLAQSPQLVRIETAATSLNQLAQALVLVN